MQTVLKLDLAVAYWVLEQLPGEKLPQVAEQAICDGYQSESLFELAGEAPTTVRDSAELFERVLSDNNMIKPNKLDAALCIARYFAKEIVAFSISPYEGAKRIVEDVCDNLESTPHALASFVGLESEYEDFSDSTRKEYYGETHCELEKNRIENDILNLAQSFLDGAA